MREIPVRIGGAIGELALTAALEGTAGARIASIRIVYPLSTQPDDTRAGATGPT